MKNLTSGQLQKQAFGAEAKPAAGVLTVFYGGLTQKIPVGKDGHFSILPEYDLATNSGLLLSAADRKGSSRISIILDKTAFEQTMPAFLQVLADSLSKKPAEPVITYDNIKDHFSLGIENHQWIEEVVIRRKKTRKELSMTDFAVNKKTATK